MTRVLRIEFRSGTAPVAALVMFGTGVWMLAIHPDAWSGRWAGLGSYTRQAQLILCALMVAAGAWQAGRERRRHIEELLGSMARPAWQPLLTAWLAVSLGGTAGYLATVTGAALLVGRVATYTGGLWWWALAVGVLALWAASALGVLVGRHVPLRVIAPIAGLTTFVGLGIASYRDIGAVWLSPVYTWGPERLVPGGMHALQAGWFLALTATLLTLVARLHWAALVSVVTAVAFAVPIVTGPGTQRLRTDPGAVELVCTEGGPQVCVARINAFMLDDVASLVQPYLRRLEDVPGAPTRVVDDVARPPREIAGPSDDTLWISLTDQATPVGGLAHGDQLRSEFRQIVYPTCERGPESLDERVIAVGHLAMAWLVDEPPSYEVPIDRLRALPIDEQRTWFARYLVAAQECDDEGLIRLMDQL